MIKVYWKQAWELLKQNKLFSMLYIVGTGLAIFWLQTRTRREEVGVMLSFGATRSDICPPADGRRHGIDRGRFTDWFSALFAICTERRAGQRTELGGEHRELLGVGFHLALSARVARHLTCGSPA